MEEVPVPRKRVIKNPMSPEKRREVSRLGGLASVEAAKRGGPRAPHRFTKEEAAAAGRKSGGRPRRKAGEQQAPEALREPIGIGEIVEIPWETVTEEIPW